MTVSKSAVTIVCVAIVIIALPKMGVIFGTVPIYASVLLGELVAIAGWLHALRTLRDPVSAVAVSLVLLAAVIWIYHFLVYSGAPGTSPRGMARLIFNFLPITGLGIAFFVVARPQFLGMALKATKWAFYFLLVYAVLQLVFGASNVVIPNVTASYASDFEEIITRSNVIHRLGGDSFKLFGTYQNGNLFSIALVLLAPFAIYIERRISVRIASIAVLHLVIVFSASTTSYISIILLDVMLAISYPRLRVYLPMLVLLLLAFLALGYWVMCSEEACRGIDLIRAKLLERDLTENMRWTKTGLWLSHIYDNVAVLFVGEMSRTDIQFIFEVLPFSLAQYYGFTIPILFYAFFLMALNIRRYEVYKIGLLAYLFTSFGSGGLWLTPTPYLLGWVLGLSMTLDRVKQEERVRLRADSYRAPTSAAVAV